MSYVRYVWCLFVSWLVLRTYGFDPVEFRAQRRELAMLRTENDRLRVAFVNAKEAIRRLRQDAITLPSIPAASPTQYFKAAPVCADAVEVPR